MRTWVCSYASSLHAYLQCATGIQCHQCHRVTNGPIDQLDLLSGKVYSPSHYLSNVGYKVWNSTHFDVNYGAQGLERLDYVVQAAERIGVKLILAFTNNW